MKKPLLIIVAVALTITLSACALPSQETQSGQDERADAIDALKGASMADTIEQTAESVVRVDVYNKWDDKTGTGSGFAIGNPARLVTASHVVTNMSYMLAWRDDGTSFRVERVLAVDKDADVAICEIPDDAGLSPLIVSKTPAARGETAVVIASQFGLTNLATAGIISGHWDTPAVEWILFTAPVSDGSSGGPLFNGNGEVIGMVMGTYQKAQNLNLATPIDAVMEIME